MPLLRAKELTDIVTKAQCLARALRRAARRGARRCARGLSVARDRGPVRRRRSARARRAGGAQGADVRQRRHGGRGHGADRVHVGHDRQAEGHDALPPRRRWRCATAGRGRRSRAAPDALFTGSPPLAFTFGLGGLLLFPLSIGAATLLIERPSPDVLLPAIAKHRANVLFTAPTSYRAMAAEARRHDLSSLAKCVSAGEALPAATRKLWKEATGIEMIDGIGATEMLHIFISHDEAHAKPGATGRPIPGYRACVMDDAGQSGAGRARSAGSRSRGRPAAAISPTTGRRPTCRAAGTTPATPTSSTPTATSCSRRAPTT